jgi:indole-3-glycerol phosphate synthase/phosphoribosylanthranilate isomerase
MAEPGGILGEIVARKRSDVAARLGPVSIEALRTRAEPTRRSLEAALAEPGARFILEVKKASPSAGAIRADADPAALARAYAPSASAISVLTDGAYFGGALEDLAAVRTAFDGPILAKDFVIDPRQVVEARLHGADAVLAMLSVLDDGEAAAVIEEARRFGMDVLVEAHDESELRRAIALDARVIGINNRDLRTLEVDLAITERLAPIVPRDRLVVAESGIGSRGDVERLAPYADAFLVGTSLMRAQDPGAAARALAFGRVKACGLCDAADILMVAAAGASFAGLIMVPGTTRALSAAEAQPLAQAAWDAGIGPVGVFRNAKVMEVADTARRLRLAAVQLHGEEDLAYLKALRGLLPDGTEIWAATSGDEPVRRSGADRTLFDSCVGGRTGGTGITFDWSQLRGTPELGRGLLAGGLQPANAAAAAKIGAWALDVGSGLEAAPRRKHPAKTAAFFGALRIASRQDADNIEGNKSCG